MRNLFSFIVLFALSFTVQSAQRKNFVFEPLVYTSFPLFVGGGAALYFHQKFRIDVMVGLNPEPYYNTIGSVAVELGGNESYDDVIEASFQDNSMLRIGMQYHFQAPDDGWYLGAGLYRLQAEGTAGIDTVLSAATGNDYTNLVNLLLFFDRDTNVDITSELKLVEIYAGRKIPLKEKLNLGLGLGVAKVMSSDILLETGLSNFEASESGSSLLRDTERDLEEIVTQYGVSIMLSFSIGYVF